ncbi:unnamed protein product, partial [Arabidopsis halleri]
DKHNILHQIIFFIYNICSNQYHNIYIRYGSSKFEENMQSSDCYSFNHNDVFGTNLTFE